MATVATYHATALAIAYASAKSMIDVFNATASPVINKVYRIYQWNSGNGTATLLPHKVNRTTAASVGTTVTPVKHDTTNSALDAHVTAGTGRTITRTDLFRSYLFANGIAQQGAYTIRTWDVMIPFTLIWDSGYKDSNVKPIVCNATQGVEVQSTGVTATGKADLDVEFTSA